MTALGLFLVTPACAGEISEAEVDYTLGMKYYAGWDDNCSCYNNRGHVGQNVKQAAEWFRKAAELGLAKGQYRLGQAYDSGQGVAQDYQVARQWYLKAAAQSDRDAEAALGDIYSLGHGVKKDVMEAASWYYKAAEQGAAHAQYELGKLYFSGSGVKQDYTEAYIWLGLAAKEIDDAMDRRDESGEHLTSDQLRAAREHIERWHPTMPIANKKQQL